MLPRHQIAQADAEARDKFAQEAQQLREQLDRLNTEHSNLLELQEDALPSSTAAALRQQVAQHPAVGVSGRGEKIRTEWSVTLTLTCLCMRKR